MAIYKSRIIVKWNFAINSLKMLKINQICNRFGEGPFSCSTVPTRSWKWVREDPSANKMDIFPRLVRNKNDWCKGWLSHFSMSFIPQKIYVWWCVFWRKKLKWFSREDLVGEHNKHEQSIGEEEERNEELYSREAIVQHQRSEPSRLKTTVSCVQIRDDDASFPLRSEQSEERDENLVIRRRLALSASVFFAFQTDSLTDRRSFSSLLSSVRNLPLCRFSLSPNTLPLSPSGMSPPFEYPLNMKTIACFAREEAHLLIIL